MDKKEKYFNKLYLLLHTHKHYGITLNDLCNDLRIFIKKNQPQITNNKLYKKYFPKFLTFLII